MPASTLIILPCGRSLRDRALAVAARNGFGLHASEAKELASPTTLTGPAGRVSSWFLFSENDCSVVFKLFKRSLDINYLTAVQQLSNNRAIRRS